MPLIDLNSMTDDQIREEARQWSIEPSGYDSIYKLKKDINKQREMRASKHYVYNEQVDNAMAAKPKPPKEHTEDEAVAVDNKNVTETTHEATITRPTPNEPKNTNEKAQKANKEMQDADNSVKDKSGNLKTKNL